MKNNNKVINILIQNNLKVTPPRISVLDIFLNTKEPLSAEKIIEKLKGKDINDVTIYRTIKSFNDKSMIRQIDLRQNSVFYEITDHHHHHIVCVHCGFIEDIEICIPEEMQREICSSSKKFKQIIDHSLEFFGKCKKCIKR